MIKFILIFICLIYGCGNIEDDYDINKTTNQENFQTNINEEETVVTSDTTTVAIDIWTSVKIDFALNNINNAKTKLLDYIKTDTDNSQAYFLLGIADLIALYNNDIDPFIKELISYNGDENNSNDIYIKILLSNPLLYDKFDNLLNKILIIFPQTQEYFDTAIIYGNLEFVLDKKFQENNIEIESYYDIQIDNSDLYFFNSMLSFVESIILFYKGYEKLDIGNIPTNNLILPDFVYQYYYTSNTFLNVFNTNLFIYSKQKLKKSISYCTSGIDNMLNETDIQTDDLIKSSDLCNYFSVDSAVLITDFLNILNYSLENDTIVNLNNYYYIKTNDYIINYIKKLFPDNTNDTTLFYINYNSLFINPIDKNDLPDLIYDPVAEILNFDWNNISNFNNYTINNLFPLWNTDLFTK